MAKANGKARAKAATTAMRIIFWREAGSITALA
jgi:hypothetical protein